MPLADVRFTNDNLCNSDNINGIDNSNRSNRSNRNINNSVRASIEYSLNSSVVMSENTAVLSNPNGVPSSTISGTTKVILPIPISTKAASTTTMTTSASAIAGAVQQESRPSSSGSVSGATSPIALKPSSPTIAQTFVQPLSPTIITTPAQAFELKDDVISVRGRGGGVCEKKVSALSSSATATLHKKDSGTSMSASATHSGVISKKGSSNNISNHNNSDQLSHSRSGSATAAAAAPPSLTGATSSSSKKKGSRRASQSDATAAAVGLLSPAGRVLTRPLSTSKLSSTPLTAPHILPNQRYAGFNLAALGQLSPSASTAATMTMSRADSLAYLNANGLPHSSYFGTVSGAGTRSMIETLALAGPQEHHGDGVVSPSGGSGNNGSGRTMCGSDAISLLDLEDNDLVMIDSNGNSSNSGVTGTAIVSETIASASAIVSKNSQSSSSHNPFSHFGGGVGGGGRGSGGTLTYSASTALMEASGTAAVTSGSNNHHYPGGSSASSNLSPRSSLPSLTTQAKKDAMQRAAMIAAIQQNGGAKILTAHRVGRRHDRPSRGIRFGEFHRICEIEYGFKEGKPLIANGRTLVHTASVQRIEDDSIQEDMLYLFSDVLVTGTKIKPVPSSSTTEDYLDHGPKINEGVNVKIGELDVPYPLSISSEGQPTQDSVLTAAESEEAVFDNPYAGHLENQQISRLTQVQADVVEGDERPLLKLTVPQVTSVLLFGSTSSRDNFLTLLSETTVAHKHHLLFQSKYLADLKKFKRHSAFSFDTSFLKTWGIPGGLNLGSIRHTAGNGGSGHSIIGPGTFTASPTNSPGGGAFDPYQYQQHLNRPQSMAGSLFNFALNGGSFPSFTSSSSDHHSKESSYATLRGANATQALQYHHQQQQMLQQQLQNRLSTTSFSGGGGIGGRPGIGDRTSSGSAFDALWFMKGSETFKQQPPRRTAAEAVSAISHEDKELKKDDDSSAGVPPATTMTGSASSSLHSSSSTTNLSSLSSNGSSAIANIGNYANRLSSSGFSSQHHVGTLRGGDVGWVRDEDATVCMVCSITKFGVLVRKHHCRLCGRVICWKCCQMKDAILLKPSNDSNGDNTSVVQEQQQLRKPIRVCLECIEQDAEDSPQQQQQEQEPSSPQSPQSPLSFPLQGVFGKLMNATISSPHLVTSAMNATGSTFTMPHQAQAHRHPQIPFQMSQPSSLYPRATSFTRNGTAYPHHHRASLYRIDVERVGEEDEGEEEEEEKEKEEERQDNSRWAADMTHQPSEHTNDSTSAVKEVRDNRERSMDVTDSQPSSSSSSLSKIMKSNHGTLRLKDLDPSDINEEEVNSQIMSLESEVESLLIQSAAAAAAAAAASSPMAFTGTNYSSANAGKTRVLRSMPKEFFEVSGFLGERGDIDEGEGEAEEKTVEELLAQQEGLQHMLA